MKKGEKDTELHTHSAPVITSLGCLDSPGKDLCEIRRPEGHLKVIPQNWSRNKRAGQESAQEKLGISSYMKLAMAQ